MGFKKMTTRNKLFYIKKNIYDNLFYFCSVAQFLCTEGKNHLMTSSFIVSSAPLIK